MLDIIEADIKSDKKYYRDKRQYFEDHREDVLTVATELKLGNALIRAQSTADSIDLHISGTAQELKQCFRAFRTLGYAPSSRPTETKLASFTCMFTHPDKKVQFWINFTSTVCKRVKIGTEMIESNVYETVCG
ncbi:MAG: hypothetical protein KAS38_15575 [Anaerolineales bacterium]|nr:hypothetical protein [Anaerolineales bacterium]